MPRKTPAKTPAKTPEPVTPGNRPNGAPKTPSRIARMEEKAELQDLNKRLEFYILKQRERDASAGSIQRTISENRDFYEKEIEKLKSLHDAQVAAFRKQRDEKDSESERLAQENKRQANMVKQYTSQISADKYRLSELEDRVATTSQECTSLRNKYVSAQEEAKKATHKLKVTEASVRNLETNLKDSEDASVDTSEDLAKAQSNAKNLQEDYAAMQHKADEEATRANALDAELCETRATVEDELRKIFGDQLKEILQERQRQYEEEQAAGLSDLKELYAEKVSTLQDECNKLQSDLVQAHSHNAEAAIQADSQQSSSGYESVISTWESRVESLQNLLSTQRGASDARAAQVERSHAKEIAAFKAEIGVLEGQLQNGTQQNAELAKAEEEVEFHKKERATLRSEIVDQKKKLAQASALNKKADALQRQVDYLSEQNSQLKVDKDQCEVEYISLMDVKVALDMEIRAYRLLLDNEEHRLQPVPAVVEVEEDNKHAEEEESTNLKRRRSTVVTPAPKAKRARQGTARKSTARKSRAKATVDDDDDDTPAKPTFKISDMDATKCVKVQNASKEQQSLDGWSLKVHSNKKAFMFPDAAPVKPGKTVTVWFGTGKKPAGAVLWDEEDVFASKDKVFLMSPEGVGHSSVEFSE